MSETPSALTATSPLRLRRVAGWRGIRVLAWAGDFLYGCRGYQILRICVGAGIVQDMEWETVARFRPVWWRSLTTRNALSYRLLRDGFHALAIPGSPLDGQSKASIDDHPMVGAVPGALVIRTQQSDEFQVTHKIQRGTRPLHIAAVPSGTIYWGEYFDNRERAEVHVYASNDQGSTWQVAYTFPAGSIRHIHNIVYDPWGDCLWILTGDEGAECKVLRASCDLRAVQVVLSGNQQARAVASIPTEAGLYFATDTPFEKNHIYRLDPTGRVSLVGDLVSSSIFACCVGCGRDRAMFFSTMIEPSPVNSSRDVQIAGSRDGANWQALATWKKDRLPMRYFQYGNAILPDGENATHYLAATTIAVKPDDLVTTLWEVESA